MGDDPAAVNATFWAEVDDPVGCEHDVGVMLDDRDGVAAFDEAIEDEQARAMEAFPELEHPTLGSFQTVAPPFRIAGTPIGAKQAAPALGADGNAVLRESGLNDEEIAKLLDEQGE